MGRFEDAEGPHDSEDYYGAEYASVWANLDISVDIERVYWIREHVETVY